MHFKGITLWHKMPDGTFSRMYFEHSILTKTVTDLVNNQVNTRKTNVRLRIYTARKTDISVGDRICEGYITNNEPTKNSYIICSIKENFDLLVRFRHYRLDCV